MQPQTVESLALERVSFCLPVFAVERLKDPALLKRSSGSQDGRLDALPSSQSPPVRFAGHQDCIKQRSQHHLVRVADLQRGHTDVPREFGVVLLPHMQLSLRPPSPHHVPRQQTAFLPALEPDELHQAMLPRGCMDEQLLKSGVRVRYRLIRGDDRHFSARKSNADHVT
jgi:hypothetical protein